MYDITSYTVSSRKITKPVTVALLSDLHAKPYAQVLDSVEKRGVDLITVAGDFINGRENNTDWCSGFFDDIGKIAPTVAVIGNHEYYYKDFNGLTDACRKPNVTLLCNNSCRFGELNIGGLSSRYDLKWLAEYDKSAAFKLLLCHQPEYFPKYIKATEVDLVFSGHAHGGQIRLFGRGLFAPNQYFFPKYSGGMYCGSRLIVGRGLSNNVIIPRFFNRREIVFVTIQPALSASY